MLNKKQHKDVFQEIQLGQENSVIQEESQEYDEENRRSVVGSGHKPVEAERKPETPFEHEEIQFGIEYKYCTVCNLEQPLRCKHCKECDNCVATFDHHCPWLGTCIGERNRPVFLVYLFF